MNLFPGPINKIRPRGAAAPGVLEYKNNKFKSSTMRIYIFPTYSCEASRLFIKPNQVAELGKKRARKESQRESLRRVLEELFFLSERTEVENISLLLLLHLVHTEGAIRGAWWW